MTTREGLEAIQDHIKLTNTVDTVYKLEWL